MFTAIYSRLGKALHLVVIASYVINRNTSNKVVANYQLAKCFEETWDVLGQLYYNTSRFGYASYTGIAL